MGLNAGDYHLGNNHRHSVKCDWLKATKLLPSAPRRQSRLYASPTLRLPLTIPLLVHNFDFTLHGNYNDTNNDIMLRQDFNRIDPKRRNVVDHRKKQFATPTYKDLDYPHRLNFYSDPPTADITLEQFEQWAIDRLRGR